MATKSILKDVYIRDPHLAKNLMSALENAENKSSKVVTFSRGVEEVKGDSIRKLFHLCNSLPDSKPPY
jgi:hypothetical protein